MKIHHYSKETGEAVGKSIAGLDPLENKPLIPAQAVAIAPPGTGANQAAMWNGSAWEIVDDYRGFIGYDAQGVEHKIDALGIKPDATWTTTPPPPTPPTAAEQLAQTDAGMVRVIEDLTDTLIAKNIIKTTDLPQAAKDKLATRKALRA